MPLKRVALVVFGLFLGLSCLEVGLRVAGWMFLRARQPAQLPAKQANQIRILCLGESTTADLMFMGKESYPAQLERILNERSTNTKFSVINGGVPATTTDEILARLPADLERYQPDIVVTMMGINDSRSLDSAFQIAGRLRVWKLARMLYYTWRPDPQAAIVDKYGPQPPGSILVTGTVAWQRILEGRDAEAQKLLQPIVEQDTWLVPKWRATAMMAVSTWQQGDDAAAERYHRQAVELERQLPRSKTIGNYRALRRLLAQRRIPLVAVQYPGLPLDTLRNIVEHDPQVTFVDNEETFLQLTRERRVREVYRDLFGGLFGHLTPYANGLLAENVARAILAMVADGAVRRP